MIRNVSILMVLCSFIATSFAADPKEKTTHKMALMILHTAEGPKIETTKNEYKNGTLTSTLKISPPKWIIVLDGNVAFDSVDALKVFLKGKKGIRLEWAPGCSLFGGEPIISNEKDLESFKGFCKENSIEFILHPSG